MSKPPLISPREKKLITASPGIITGREAMQGMSQLEKALVHWAAEPVDFVKDVFGVTPEDYQGEILLDLTQRGKDRVAAKSAHGTGKTTCLSWFGWHFLITLPMSRVVATAPVQAQLRDVLWPEFSKWGSAMPIEMRSMWELSSEHIRSKAAPNEWFAVARTSNKPENLQGFHNTFLAILIDEASAVPANVFEVIEGALSDAGAKGGKSKLFMAGNPNFASGELFDAFGKNKRLYSRYTLSGDPETKFTPMDGRAFVSDRVTAAYRETIRSKYGMVGPIYDIRVRGQFPSADDKAVLPLGWLQRAMQIEPPPFDPVADGVIIACDPARYGVDETTICVRRRNAIIKLDAFPKTSTFDTAALVDAEAQRWEDSGITVLDIRVDEPGVGGGVIDTLRRDPAKAGETNGGFGRAVTPYNGGKPLVKGVDPEDEIRNFINRRARDYWKVRRGIETDQMPLVYDEEMAAQGATVHYDRADSEKIKVESKRNLKDRLGEGASPDRIDVIVIAYADFNSMAEGTGAHVDEADVEYGREREKLEDWA